MNKYIDALEYIENEEVLYEDVYNEDDVSFSKEILCEVEYLKEHFDTLHELINNYNECRNELCLKCGNYRESHLGKCDGCRWYK